jgi:selenocysteine lyase/cysteine desulfurase
VFGNPHSESAASRASTDALETARGLTLKMFDADPAEYDVVFTANASGAIRILAESFPFSSGSRLVMTADNHNSVNGLREFARSRGAVTQYVPFGSPDLRVDDEAIRRALARRKRRGAGTGRRRGLFAYPAQSNFSGVQHPLR